MRISHVAGMRALSLVLENSGGRTNAPRAVATITVLTMAMVTVHNSRVSHHGHHGVTPRLHAHPACTTKDNTKYTRATRSFLTHHGRRISHAIVIVGAQSIMNEILKLKKSALAARPAQ